LYRRHGVAVWSVLILLRREADHPSFTGQLQIHLPDQRRCHWFDYQVVRVWEKPLASVLGGGLGTLPLAPLCDEAGARIPRVIDQMKERIDAEATAAEKDLLWAATYFLMGLRYPVDETTRALRGDRAMKESVTYQATLEEGRVEGAVCEARKFLLLMGRKRLGEPPAQIATALEGITDLTRLEHLGERLLEVSSWQELLSPSPARRRRGGGKKPS
jgi:hypothetical protein